jgi:hypothetical protein
LYHTQYPRVLYHLRKTPYQPIYALNCDYRGT